jgi:hypothetical protein
MAEQFPPTSSGADALRDNLHRLGTLLSETDRLEPETRQELACLVDELARALDEGRLEPETTAHLADSTAHMLADLRRQPRGLFTGAVEGLERLVVHAEGDAPVATGFAERLIDVLSSIGI